MFYIYIFINHTLRRNAVTLLVELLVPVVIIVCLSLIQRIIKPTIVAKTYPSTFMGDLPNFGNSGFGMISLVDIEAMQFTKACGTSTLLWHCFRNRIKCDRSVNVTSVCQPRKIVVAPFDRSNLNAINAAKEFVDWGNQHVSVAKPFLLMDSEAAVLSAIDNPSYGISDTKSIFSSAVILKSGYPTWEYTIRLNKTQHFSGRQFKLPRTSIADVDFSVRSGKILPEIL